jgi:tetrahydromethanopterin S-methyltransferase subunit B
MPPRHPGKENIRPSEIYEQVAAFGLGFSVGVILMGLVLMWLVLHYRHGKLGERVLEGHR